MYVSIVMWDLSHSEATIDSLREYLRGYAVDAYTTVEGLRLKVWFANAERHLWGAVYLWDGIHNLAGITQISRAIEIIGYPPTTVGHFGLEAIAEGNSVVGRLGGQGFALESRL